MYSNRIILKFYLDQMHVKMHNVEKMKSVKIIGFIIHVNVNGRFLVIVVIKVNSSFLSESKTTSSHEYSDLQMML